MIISTITDPRLFGRETIMDELSKREVIRFLEAIAQNGVLVDDPKHTLLRKAIEAAQTLGTTLGQRILLLLQEFLTNASKFVVAIGPQITRDDYPVNLNRQLLIAGACTKSDAVITGRRFINSYGGTARPQIEFGVLAVEDWSESSLEVRRTKFLHPDESLDMLNAQELDDWLCKLLRYATTLRLLDPLIVASNSRIGHYYDGIAFLVATWKHRSIFKGSPLKLEIVTTGNRMTQNGFLSGSEASQRLSRGILGPLVREFGCEAVGSVKIDSDPSIFHARFIQVGKRTFSIDPGFDGLGRNGPVRRCFLRLETAGDKHVEECLKLRDAAPAVASGP